MDNKANEYSIEMKNISKSFPGIKANDNISFSLKKGEILGLLGENGAGKSTLMSILFGLYTPDEGEIWIKGKQVKINNPKEATEYGVGMVHQHFKLVPTFSVLENTVLGIEDTTANFLSMSEARKKIIEISDEYNFNLDPDAIIEDITVGMQQRVEILKMLYRENDILIFDEPTAVLTSQEIEEILNIMKKLADNGKTIIFITHKLKEIQRVCDRVLIMRKGKHITTLDSVGVSVSELSELMVGRKVDLNFTLPPLEKGNKILKLRDLKRHNTENERESLKGISFDVYENEILAIAGIDGNGQSELVKVITGLSNLDSGNIYLNDVDISTSTIRKRNTSGISHIPEDRQKHGLILDFNLENNLALQRYFEDEFHSKGFRNFRNYAKNANKLIEDYSIMSAVGKETIVRTMSGGNQQKAILARELERDHNLLIAVQPTRGLDVSAIEYIHNKIIEERNSGKGVLLVSYELSEVLGISDRILVMYEGEIVGELYPKDTNEVELGLYMSGVLRKEVTVDEDIQAEV